MPEKKCEHDRRRSTCSACSPEQVFKAYQRSARERQLPFTLTLDQFIELVQRPCAFCGTRSTPRGVDRRDNRQGYVYGNCQAACADCNKLKAVWGQQEFLGLVLRIARHQEELKSAETAAAAGASAPTGLAVPSPPCFVPAPPRTDLAPEALSYLETGFHD